MEGEHFRRVEPNPSFPSIEKEVLAKWKREHTFEASLEKNRGRGEEFVFYDGPPFPTGTPHHGTIFVSILKDLIPRYKTMRGYYVPRGWGWDCHGLPIETLAERNLGIKEKSEIERTIGVAAFNNECRRIVSEFNAAWEEYIDALGRWVDFKNPYQTLDRSFMESVMWSFATCYEKGLIYKDYRVTPYCYRCETPLSVSDTRLDDATRPRQDRTITVRFKVKGQENLSFLAWTTTPWTLPSNLALAVGSEINYAFVRHGEEIVVIAEDRIASYAAELGKDPEVVETVSGSDLLSRGYRYEPLFPYFAEKNPNGFRLLPGSFVSTEEGTGIVHMAPAFGEDDYWLCRAHQIAVQAPVDAKGLFTEEVPEFAGQNVHDANGEIVRVLKGRGVVIRDQTLEHNYPHCWRCRTPLIYKAVDAWYFSVEKIKDALLRNNDQISWAPDTVKSGRFGNWLANARDWNISRNRYWATPIPVWECSGCRRHEVLGSLSALEEKAGRPLADLHKEFLDEIRYPCSSCDGTMQRVPEVLDGWYESGSMPYGQYHYPFENAEHFRSHFPCDFIVEYTGQIRGWFYYLHVLATALFDRPAFRNCLVHGTLLAADGKKISKSQKNYTDPMELMRTHGADALRAYLLSSNAVQMADLNFRDDGVEGMVKSISLPLWNALSFFTTYAEADDIAPGDIRFDDHRSRCGELDRFILSELEILLRGVTANLDSYAIHEAAKLLPPFLDTLNNWYIRRSRPRVWSEEKREPDKLVFYAVLHRVLSRFTQLLSPFCPFLSEAVWSALGHTESVHLSDWPAETPEWIDESLSATIAVTRRIVSAGLAIRSREKIRVRQPLHRARVALSIPVDISGQLSAVKEELNVKEVELLQDESEIADRLGKANARELGPVFGKDTQTIIQAVKAGDFTISPSGHVEAGGFTLEPGLVEVVYRGKEGLAVESVPGAVVALDTRLSHELLLEGHARDLVRFIQDLRKEAGLKVSDRIQLAVLGADEVLAAHGEYIARETLAVQCSLQPLTNPPAVKKGSLGEAPVEIQIQALAVG